MGSQARTFPYLPVTTAEMNRNMNHHTRSCWPVAERIWLIECRYISSSILIFSAIILGESGGSIGDIEGPLVVVRNSVSSTHRSFK